MTMIRRSPITTTTDIDEPLLNQENIMKVVKIKSSEWIRGSQGETSSLYNSSTNRMCCLGICLIRTHGVPAEQIKDIATPGEAWAKRVEMPDQYRKAWITLDNINTHSARDAMSINDAIQRADLAGRLQKDWSVFDENPITDEDRIAMLRPIFREAGYIIHWYPNE